MIVPGKFPRLLFVLSAAGLCGLLGSAAGQPPTKGQPPAKSQPPAKGAEKTLENYYRDARLGDWVSHTTGAGAAASTFKQTVTAKTADEITIKYEIKSGGTDFPASENKINLKEAYDPNKVNAPDVTSTVEKLGSGQETLTVGGKPYNCTWEKTKVTHTSKATAATPAMTTVVTTKSWICKDVPLGGLVKSETEMSGQTAVMELAGFGRGK